ncbi:hypothetical protein LJ707_02420 [Mucilaginibacter sp. UR6-1]|uniref:hypothetical protein n=1 Tax=Mucilaginibacter sp. UR6-1 TaxID=1435643 RepID=UPI001E297EB1|nr:hypothetical protein [Mucilaginibacter sp. UR6-1]MCC8407767.1 hypothetical protein [Mucilaginibacter sp. UR6-1]
MHKLSRCGLIITGIAAWSAGITARDRLRTLSVQSIKGIFQDASGEFSWLICSLLAISVGLAVLSRRKDTQEALAKRDRHLESTFFKILSITIIMALIFAALSMS